MKDNNPTTRALWPDNLARQIDSVCDRFESAWQAASEKGARPILLEYLPKDTDTALPLVRELLHLDIDYRRRAGEEPRPNDYSDLAGKYGPALLAIFLNDSVHKAMDKRPCQQMSESPIISGLEIMEELGKGAMGVVHKACDVALGRLVAIKRLKSASTSPGEIQRFYQEARAAAQLNHPNVVRIFAVGQFEGQPCFTMQFVAGGSLAEHRERLRGDLKRCSLLMEKIALGVHAAHKAGIIHRDLKPGNVLLDEAGEPLVADFGLAKLAGSDEATQTGDVLGTPGYMAPEQVAGRSHQVTAASDIWSLGVILYELLIGQRPFVGTRLEVARAIESQELPRPRILPAALQTIVCCCLEKKSGDRYPTAEALAADLRCWLDGKPVLGRQISWYRKAERFVRRRTSAIAALTILLLALTGAVLASTPQAPQMRHAEDDPAHREKQITDLLKRGEAVTLLDEKNRPNRLRLAIVPDIQVNLPGADTAISANELTLLLLLKEQLLPAFRMKAEVLAYQPGSVGRAGIFFNFGSYSSAKGTAHVFTDLTFSNLLQPKTSSVALQVTHYRPLPSSEPILCYVPPKRRELLPDLPLNDKYAVYRTLELVAEAEQVSGYIDGRLVRQSTKAEFQKDRATALLGRVPPAGLPAYPLGGLGLVIDRGSAAFRKVTIEPIKAK